MLDELELEGADETTDILDSVIPELAFLCANRWVMELIIEVCKAKEKKK